MAENEDLLKYIKVASAYQSKAIPNNKGYTFISNANGIPQAWKSDGYEEANLWGNYPDRVLAVYHSPTGNEAIIGIDDKGDEKEQFYLQQTDSDELEKLVYEPAFFHKFGGWSPDGRQICFSSNRRNPGYFDVFTVDVKTKELRTVLEYDGICEPVCWSADGESIIMSVDKTNIEKELSLLHIESGELSVIGKKNELAHYSTVQLTKDGETGYVLTSLGEDTVYVGRFETDQPDTIEKVYGVDNWDVEELQLSPTEKELAFTVNEEGYSTLMIFDLTENTATRLDNMSDGVIDSLSWLNEDALIFTLKTATIPGDIWLYNVRNQSTTRLTTVSNNEVLQERWIEPSLRKFKSFDGLEVPYFLYEKGAEKNRPAVVYVHGGPESQIRPTYNPVIQYLAERGFAVIAPNVRGSKGYGEKYIKLDDGRKRMDAVKDLTWLAKDLHTSLGIDPDRIGVIGRSYGGFMVLASLTHFPTYWKAGVNIVGISHFTSFLQNTGSWRRHLRECEYGSLAHDQEFFEKISPLHRADQITAPLLVFHGRNDTRVPVSEAEQLVTGMKERGQIVDFTVFEDEGHQTERLENVITMHTESIQFFEKHLR